MLNRTVVSSTLNKHLLEALKAVAAKCQKQSYAVVGVWGLCNSGHSLDTRCKNPGTFKVPMPCVAL